jgi:hypothetical protein
MGRLTNAQGLLANSESIDLIFDRPFTAGANGLIDGSIPTCQAFDADVAANSITRGAPISIDGVPLKVRDMHPDGTGLTVLMLEEA